MSNKKSAILLGIAAVAMSVPVLAAVSTEEAKQLGTTLTPWGAEKAGNKDGSIPAFTAETIKAPANFDPKQPGIRPDPFGSDKVLFSITAQNYQQYSDKLSDGQKALFKMAPNFRMDIYQTRRTANYPKYVVDNMLKNATSCKTDATEDKLVDCYGGVPFPIPTTGKQVMWNHLTQYKNYAWAGDFYGYVVGTNGQPTMQALTSATQQSEFYNPKRTKPAVDSTIYFQYRGDLTAPARRNGEKLVVANTLDGEMRAWQYIPGQRRVKLAPDLAYDTPNPQSGGVYTMDDSQAFLGKIDRYDFKLVGKKEMYIPYNVYKANDPKTCPASKFLTPGFANPECMRWELHRTWVVSATLKPTYRHIYQKRTFYWDEDIPGTGMADNYDARGSIYRYVVVVPFVYYEGPGMSADNYIAVDLQKGAYSMAGFPQSEAWHTIPPTVPTFFSPEALAGEGIR